MGAVYFEIKNTNTEDDFLIKASSPNAKSVMIHETQRMGNMTHMKHHSNGTSSIVIALCPLFIVEW